MTRDEHYKTIAEGIQLMWESYGNGHTMKAEDVGMILFLLAHLRNTDANA